MFERAKPTRPCAEMPAAVDANPPSSTYWAADATVSRVRECWPVTHQPPREYTCQGRRWPRRSDPPGRRLSSRTAVPGSLLRGPPKPRVLPAATVHHLQVDRLYF